MGKIVSIIGIDLAKNTFQAHGSDSKGRVIFSKKLSRSELIEFMAVQPKCLVGMEASNGSFYFARKFESMGHQVKLMPAGLVKKYVVGNKTDKNDAAAICQAVARPDMRFVNIKSQEQQALCQLHKARQGLVTQRLSMMNQIRGFLLELGYVFIQGRRNFYVNVLEILSNNKTKISEVILTTIKSQLKILEVVDTGIAEYDKQLSDISKGSAKCQQLETIPGIGDCTSTAIIGHFNDTKSFPTARHFASCLGLTPREFSSGNTKRLGKITKRGNSHIRKLLVNGAITVIRYCKDKTDRRSVWIRSLVESKGVKKAAVAIANKDARVAWKILQTNEVVVFKNEEVVLKAA